MRRVLLAVCILGVALLTGCANRLNCVTAPAYRGKTTPVARLGITGHGSTAAIPAFQEAGYRVVDLGSGDRPLDAASEQGIPFVASVDAVGTDGAWWDGFFDFAMRVTEVAGRSIVWSATSDYGGGGITINQNSSTREAMHDMVADFARAFPPAKDDGEQDGSPPN